MNRNLVDLIVKGVIFVAVLACDVSARNTRAAMLPDKPADANPMRGAGSTEARIAVLESEKQFLHSQVRDMRGDQDKIVDELGEVRRAVVGLQATLASTAVTQTVQNGGFGIIFSLSFWRWLREREAKSSKEPSA